MKITLNRALFSEALDLTSNVIAKKSINPILNNVLLNAKENFLEIIATDLEVSLIIKLEAQITEPGQLTVMNSLLREIVKAAQSEAVSLETGDSGNVKVKAPGTPYQANLHSIPAEDFPVPNRDELSSAPSFFIKGFTLKEMLSKNLPFAAKDDVRYTFNSVFFEKENLEFKTVSSDTKRLALAKTFVDAETKNFTMLIPIKAAKIIRDFLETADSDLEIKIMPKKSGFICDNMTLISNQIGGTFPDYRMVIPDMTNHLISLSKSAFLFLIKSLTPFLTGDIQKIILSFKPGNLIAYTDENELGKGENSLQINYEGESFEMAFSYRFLLDIISAIDEEEMLIKIKETDKPAIFIGKDNEKALFVSVPMQR